MISSSNYLIKRSPTNCLIPLYTSIIWISASCLFVVYPWPISRCLGGTCSRSTVTRTWRSGWWCSTWWGWSNQGAGHCLTTPTDWPKVRSTVIFIYCLHKKIFRPSCFILAHHCHCHWVNFKLYKSFYFYVFFFSVGRGDLDRDRALIFSTFACQRKF